MRWRPRCVRSKLDDTVGHCVVFLPTPQRAAIFNIFIPFLMVFGERFHATSPAGFLEIKIPPKKRETSFSSSVARRKGGRRKKTLTLGPNN